MSASVPGRVIQMFCGWLIEPANTRRCSKYVTAAG